MRGIDGWRGHMGRYRRTLLMMIVMMMNVAPRIVSIPASDEDDRWLRRQTGSTAQNRGARRAAARHGAAGHGYGWKTKDDHSGNVDPSLRS